MCGICGVVDFEQSEPIPANILKAMTHVIVHRGPDEDGVHMEPHAALGVRRLRIIDLAGGHQPMANEDAAIWIAHNGEIYNFRELRADLSERGHTFKTRSDTEAIVHAYEEYGEDCVLRLRGMFAFAVWDRRNHRLLLARDRLGIKPLHYWMSGSRIAFASEIKSLLCLPELERRVDPFALDLYLTYGYVPAPHSIFAGIHKLPPAHLLVADRTGISVRSYWDFVPGERSATSEQEYHEALRQKLSESVRTHLVSDVPLGAFLSGGVDSSTVVAFMSRHSKEPVKTFSIGFAESTFNELPYARLVANRFQTDHNELMVEPQAAALLPQLLAYFDEPFGDSSAIPTYLVSKFARQEVTVILTGDGGDEIFGGYEWQRRYQLLRLFAPLPASLRRLLPACASLIPVPLRHHASREKLRNFLADAAATPEDGYIRRLTLFDELSKAALYSNDLAASLSGWDSREAVRHWLQKLETTDFRSKMLYTDAHFYCPEDNLTKVDRMSMAWSLEARVPLLDHELVEFVASIPSGLKLRGLTSKYLLRRAMRDMLPASVLNKRKQGFSVPLAIWLRGPLRSVLQDLLLDARARGRGWFQAETVRRLIDEHTAGARDHSHRLWALLALEQWAREYLDRHAAPAVTGT